jgi:hypothetical protein
MMPETEHGHAKSPGEVGPLPARSHQFLDLDTAYRLASEMSRAYERPLEIDAGVGFRGADVGGAVVDR